VVVVCSEVIFPHLFLLLLNQSIAQTEQSFGESRLSNFAGGGL